MKSTKHRRSLQSSPNSEKTVECAGFFLCVCVCVCVCVPEADQLTFDSRWAFINLMADTLVPL